MLVNLLFEILLKLAEQIQIRLRVELFDAPEIASKQTSQILLIRVVQQNADIERLALNRVRDILDQEKGTLLEFILSCPHVNTRRIGPGRGGTPAPPLRRPQTGRRCPPSRNLLPVRKGPQVGVFGVHDHLAQPPPSLN